MATFHTDLIGKFNSLVGETFPNGKVEIFWEEDDEVKNGMCLCLHYNNHKIITIVRKDNNFEKCAESFFKLMIGTTLGGVLHFANRRDVDVQYEVKTVDFATEEYGTEEEKTDTEATEQERTAGIQHTDGASAELKGD